MLTFDPYGDMSGQANLNIKTNTGKVQINKIDSETRQAIEGITFQLQRLDGFVIGNATTDKNGQASFGQLYQGKYVLKEIATNEKYILDNSTFDIDVTYNKTTNKTITNEHKKGNLKIYKVDKDNHKINLGNVTFDLYSEEFKKVIGSYVTNTDGEIQINDLRIGEYKLIERNTGKWYNLAEDTNVVVNWNVTQENIIENELKKGQIQVVKIDKDDNTVKIPNVIFEVIDENDNVLERITTDSKGKALTSKYPLRDFKELKIRECQTLENYVLSSETQTVTLEENKIKDITFINEKKKGQVRVNKIDTDNHEIKLQNVEFNIIDQSGNIVETLITDQNGQATSKRLPIDQKYKLQEIKTGELYELNDEIQTVTLEQDKIVDLTICNEKKKGQVRIVKVDKDDNTILLEGITFEIKDSQGNVVDTIVTNSKGECTSKRLPIDEVYTIVESQTRKEYVLSSELQTITLEQNKITDLKFENQKKKSKIIIKKLAKEDNELTGNKKGDLLHDTTFIIYDENGEIYTKVNTEDKGFAEIILPYGKYKICEEIEPEFYLKDSEPIEIEVTENEKIINCEFENTPIKPNLEVTKTGLKETFKGEEIKYNCTIENKTNTYLQDFVFEDILPIEFVRITGLKTGIYNFEQEYKILYKTNLKNEYQTLKEGLNTKINNYIDFNSIQLENNEYITQIAIDYGKVDKGFKNISDLSIFVKVINGENGDEFENKVTLNGHYKGKYVNDNDNWKTKIYEKQIEKLPKTRKIKRKEIFYGNWKNL